MADKEQKREPDFKSRLKGRGRFLSHVIQHAFESTRRTPDDFLRHFSPAAIMTGLAKKPTLRAKILTATSGLKERVGAKIDEEAAASLLATTLSANQATGADVVAAFNPDDMVRNLDVIDLWTYVTEGDFWKESDGMAFEIAKSHIAFILDQAMDDKMLKPRDVVDAITFEVLAERLPRPELGWMLANAVGRGRQSKSFSDEDLLKEAPIGVLAEHIPLPLLWGAVVIPHIAEAHGLLRSASPEGTASKATRESSPPASAKPPASASSKPSAPPSEAPEPLPAEPTRAAGLIIPPDGAADPAPFDFSDVTDAGADAEAEALAAAGAGTNKN